MGLARDLPWQIFVSTSLGQVNLDLSQIIIQDVIVGTGFGDVRLICPYECLGSIDLRSSLGTIQVVAPEGYRVRVYAQEGRFFGVHADSERFAQSGPGIYEAIGADADAPQVELFINGTFGDAYLA